MHLMNVYKIQGNSLVHTKSGDTIPPDFSCVSGVENRVLIMRCYKQAVNGYETLRKRVKILRCIVWIEFMVILVVSFLR